jgi:asparagine synthase (glutamine-hydrolysing)
MPRWSGKNDLSHHRSPSDQPEKGLINIVKRFVEGSHLPLDGGHLRWQYFSSDDQDARLFNDGFKGRVKMDPFAPIKALKSNWSDADRLDQEIYVDLRFSMPDSVLMKVDKMSMAHVWKSGSFSGPIVEFTASLPGDWKLKRFRTKAIFGRPERFTSDQIVWQETGYSLPIKTGSGGSQGAIDNRAEGVPVIKEYMNDSFIQELTTSIWTHNHNHILGFVESGLWHQRFFGQSIAHSARA